MYVKTNELENKISLKKENLDLLSDFLTYYKSTAINRQIRQLDRKTGSTDRLTHLHQLIFKKENKRHANNLTGKEKSIQQTWKRNSNTFLIKYKSEFKMNHGH